MATKVISRRKGTTDHGSAYEQKIAALLGVKCALLDDVEDMWIATNVDGLGAFDDLVLFVQKKNGNCSSKEVYLLQIKHKKNKKVYLSAGDNDLTKYQRSFLEIRKDFLNGTSPFVGSCEFEDIKFVLFTNTQIDASTMQTDECDNKNCTDLINTGTMFQILNDASVNYDHDFLKQALFFSNQVDVLKVENVIKHEIDKYFNNCNVEAIIKFFENWHSEYFENKTKLTKEDIQSAMLEIILSSYIPEPRVSKFLKSDIWIEATKQFKFLFLKEEDHVTKIWQAAELQICNFSDDQNMNLSKWNEPLKEASNKVNKIKQHFKHVLPPIKKDKSSYKIKDLYLLLWQVCELPLILNLNTNSNSQKDICTALSKLDSSKTNRRRYTFFGEVTSDLSQYSTDFNILNIERDIRKKILKNSHVSLQGKDAVTLKELKLSDAALEKITPEVLIECLQPITKKDEADPVYIPRFILHPIVAVNVLTIPDVIFVIVTDDSSPTNYLLLNSFGITLPWRAYRFYSNTFLKEFIEVKEVKNIILKKDIISLKEYKDVEQLVNKVKQCEEQTIHYLRFLDESKLEWLHSNKNADQIKPFFVSNSDIFLPDSRLFDYLTFNILSGNAGEGKSTLLQFLAKHAPPNVWVIKLNMGEIAEYIQKGEFSGINTFLYHQSNQCFNSFKNFSDELPQSIYNELNKLIIIDGTDEIEYNLNTETLLDKVKSLGIKTIIATRPSLNDSMENKFHVPLFSLKPFTNEDCQSLIKLTLQNDTLETDINKIVHKMPKWDNVVGIPLLIKLCVSLLNDTVLDFNEFDIGDLFNTYIHKQLTKVDSCNKSTIRTLSRSALFMLYKQEAVSELFKIQEYFEDVDDKIKVFTKSKLIEKLDNNKTPVFAHKSLAEFLVAKYLFRLAEGPDSDIFHKLLRSLFYKELETVRFFFDIISLKGSALQDIITGGNLTDLYSKVNNDLVDRFGRNGLHIVASYGNRCELRTTESLWSGVKIYETYNISSNNVIYPCPKLERRTVVCSNIACKLLEMGLDPLKKDNLFKMDVFEFATETGSLEIIEALFCKNFIKQLGDVNNDVLLFSVVRDGYINIYKELRNKNLNLKVLPAMDSLLHVALCSEKLEVIKELTNSVIPIDEPNRFGYTPLISWLSSSKLDNSGEYSLAITMNMNLPLNCNQLKILNHLIDKKVNLNTVNGQGETPLHAFCGTQEQSLVGLLIQNGAQVNKKTKVGSTPLHYASRYSLENVKLLLKSNSAVDIFDAAGFTPLCYAAGDNKLDIVKYLIRKGANVNQNKKKATSPLNFAILRGHVECARLLIEKHAKIDNSENSNILVTAVLSGNLNCVKLLIDKKAKVNENLVHLAIFLNQQHIIKFLFSEKLYLNTNINMNNLLAHGVQVDDINLIDTFVSKGANVNATDCFTGDTILHLACSPGLEKTAEYLIKHKSVVNIENNFAETPLTKAAGSNNLEVLKVLVNNGSDLQKYGSDAIYAALENDHTAVLDYLILAGADINGTNLQGTAPIHYASGMNLNCVRNLTGKGADINLKTVSKGLTPLMIAAAKGFQDIVEYLIENEAKVNEEDISKIRIAMTAASQKGHIECVKFLINKGSNVSKYGPFALFFAADKGHTAIVDYLISAGADINGLIDNDKSPIHIATLESDLKVVKYLLTKGAEINLKTVLQGYTPLMLASFKGRKGVVKYLAENGAKLEERNVNQHTALILASQEGHLKCVKILINKGCEVLKYGAVAICSAAYKGHTAIVDYLILVGADINGLINNDKSPIHIATLDGHLKVVRYLLKKGAEINLKTILQDCTPLMLAVIKGRKDIVEYLAENDAKLDEENIYQHTALILASQEGHLECVKILINKGCEVFKYGSLAIYFAALGGHTTIVDYLISTGADINGLINNDKSPIHIAALESDLIVVKYLLKKGAEINLKTALQGCTPLMLAAIKGRKDIVEYLAQDGAKLDERNINQHTALIFASQEGHLECVKILINKGSEVFKYGSLAIYFAALREDNAVVDYLISVGADINGLIDNDRSPIHFATLGSDLKVVKYLLKKGAEINLKTVLQCCTPLMLAASKGRKDIVEYLADNGAKLDEEIVNHQTALIAASQESHLECVKCLIDKGSNVYKYGPLALYYAANRGHTAIVDYLISAGADINGLINNDRSPIHIATTQSDLKVVRDLLQKGAEINVKTSPRGCTPLMLAAMKGRKGIVEYLAEKGAKLDERDINQHTALICASQEGHLECVKILINKGSEVFKYGPLAIYFAALEGHTAIVDYLISAGADLNGLIDNNKSPIHVAILESDLKTVRYLLNKGADINSKTIPSGYTPLILAASEGRKDIVEYLAENDAKLDEEDVKKQTALIYASLEGHLECVKVLIGKGCDVNKYGPLAIRAATHNHHTTIVKYVNSHLST